MASESKNDIVGRAEKGGLLFAAVAAVALFAGLAHAHQIPQGIVEVIDENGNVLSPPQP